MPFLTAGSFLLSDGVGVKVIVHGIRSVGLRSRENSVLIPPTTLSFTIKRKLGCRSRKQKLKVPPPSKFSQTTTPRSGTWRLQVLCSQNNRSPVQKHWTRGIVLMIIIWELKQRGRQKVIGFDWQNNNSASHFHVLWMTGTKDNDFLLFLLWCSISYVYSPLEFNSWKNRQPMTTSKKSWNKSDEICNSANPVLGWSFRCRCRLCCLWSLISGEGA